MQIFPVVSTLRKCAATTIFVSDRHLSKEDGRYWLRLSKATTVADLARSSWGVNSSILPLYELVARGKSLEAVAVSLSKKETQLADALKVGNEMYTLVLGPESQLETDGLVTRTVRAGLLLGVYRASAPSQGTLEPLPGQRRIVRRFGGKKLTS